MEAVAIIGAGLIGRAWAAVFARAGWAVRLHDPHGPTLGAAPGLVQAELAMLREHGLADGEPGPISSHADLAGALAGAAFVQESGPEALPAKQALFAEMDRLAAPGVVLASSTSAIVASSFTEALPGRGRCLVGHPVNPPHLIPLVEICGAPWTGPEALDRADAVYRAVGQVPVQVRRETEGFVLNRLQGALLAEAFRLVADGVISPEDLDRTVSDGLGLRWSFLGPFATIELNAPGGIADYLARYTGFYARVAADPPGPGVFGADSAARIAATWPHPPEPARLAARTAWRNRRLAALQAHKRGQGTEP
ncbi:MAG TPA: 3-hydroxyacyl-CoA dehydrogenase [Acetobacteraceae bacterium]